MSRIESFLTPDGDTGEVRRTLHFTGEVDVLLGLGRFRLVGDLSGRDGFTVEHLVSRHPWYAPWRVIERWEPLLLVSRDTWTEMRFQSIHEARTWLLFNVTRHLNPYPVC